MCTIFTHVEHTHTFIGTGSHMYSHTCTVIHVTHAQYSRMHTHTMTHIHGHAFTHVFSHTHTCTRERVTRFPLVTGNL